MQLLPVSPGIFLDKGLNVPQLYAEDPANDVYLIQDLGDTTLFAFLAKERKENFFSIKLSNYIVMLLKSFPVSRFRVAKVWIIRCVIHDRLLTASLCNGI